MGGTVLQLLVTGVIPLELESGKHYHLLLPPQPDLVVLKPLQKRVKLKTLSTLGHAQTPLRVTVEC